MSCRGLGIWMFQAEMSMGFCWGEVWVAASRVDARIFAQHQRGSQERALSSGNREFVSKPGRCAACAFSEPTAIMQFF